MPPNPNEFDKTWFISLSILSFGTRFIPLQPSDNSSRFKVGGAMPFFIDNIENIASTAPDAHGPL